MLLVQCSLVKSYQMFSLISVISSNGTKCALVLVLFRQMLLTVLLFKYYFVNWYQINFGLVLFRQMVSNVPMVKFYFVKLYRMCSWISFIQLKSIIKFLKFLNIVRLKELKNLKKKTNQNFNKFFRFNKIKISFQYIGIFF